jgi:cation diffusion facilitator CzcD-associated flavoprotein CzcO
MQTSLGQTRLTSLNPNANSHTNGTNGTHTNGTTHTQTTHTPSTTNTTPPPHDLDALIVGAGFSGCYLLHLLRPHFSTLIIEAGSALGGIWHWNSYPGARVDSQYPIYQYSLPEIYRGWRWGEVYPGSAELRDYFKFVDGELGLSENVVFGTKVVGAEWVDGDDESEGGGEGKGRWMVSCDDGRVFRTRFFLPCAGFAAKRHFPNWPGLEEGVFGGLVCHSSFWPEEGVDVRGKKVAVVGTGATGVQIAQTVARECEQLTVFQRTPNMCCPMRQASLTPEEVVRDLEGMDAQMDKRYSTFAGFLYESQRELKTFDHTPEQREAHFQKLWDMGGFRLLANNYGDMMSDPKANREAYDFWARKVRERITDAKKRDILAPLEPPHPFGGKRLSLEQDFYEQMSREHVEIVDIRATPVREVTEKAIVTEDGREREFDVIAIATGFDSFTGGLKDMNILGVGGESLNEKWKMGTWTAYGMAVHQFPNMFFLYGPQAPTAYANGPSITEPQARWVLKVMKLMRGDSRESVGFSLVKPVPNEKKPEAATNGVTNGDGVNGGPVTNGESTTKWKHTMINAKRSVEEMWRQRVHDLHTFTLRNDVDSWYMGSNIPGKPREPLNYSGGIPEYLTWLEGSIVEEDGNWKGFELK